MTSTIDTRGTALVPATAGRIGQGTAVEQSRAVAEVHAAIVVAQQCPRNIPGAVADMQRSCAQKSLAEKAFFRYNRGGNQISGASVQLARELARCWGNIQYGLTELRRDDGYRQSEMQAWAWDVQTNARSSTTFIVPHARDVGGSVTELTALRDVYENNANNGARRLREMIFAILPGWYTEDAITACYETLGGDDETLAERIEQCVTGFGKHGVTEAMLAQKLGAPRPRWTAYDLATLTVVYRSLTRGETSKEEEFGVAPVAARPSAADLTPAQRAPVVPGPAAEPQRGTSPTVSPAGPGTPSGPDPTPAGSSSAARSHPPQETSPSSPSSPPPSATSPPDPAAPANPAEPAETPRSRSRHKSTLGSLRNALGKLPFEAPHDDLALLSRLTARDITMIEGLRQDEAVNVLKVVDAALLADDPETALGKLWGQPDA
jgi:hypothetical protein